MHSVLHAFTHSVVWASVIASAFVALVTTLLVEYLAKPGLEARKERILEERREQRKVTNGLGQVALLVGRLSIYHADSELYSSLDEYVNGIAKELREHVILAHKIIDIPEPIKEKWGRTTAELLAFSLALQSGRRATGKQLERLEAACDILDNFIALLRMPRWHIRRTHKLVMKIKSSSLADSTTDEATKERL
jgi:hypothetical protein